MPKKKANGSHPVDAHVGARLQRRPKLMRMTQTELGAGVGIPFQKIENHGRGSNRISVIRLYEFSNILDVSVSLFFDDLERTRIQGRRWRFRARKP